MKSDEGYELACLRELIGFVFAHREGLISPITYSELAARIGRTNKHGDGHGHGMGFILGLMGNLLLNLQGEWGEPIPHLQSLVVNKSGPLRGLPDEGIKEFWPSYPQLSYVEKLNRTRLEHQRIVDFGSRWNDILEAVGLPPIAVSSRPLATSGGFGTGGESEQHKRLKRYVLANPGIVGAGADWLAIEEYVLPSLDTIDVVFKSADACIAVEVKSVVSDAFPSDYERGLFQAVKYMALLSAMSRVGGYTIPPAIRVLLVLESKLPHQYCPLASSLGVSVIEGIKVPVNE